MKQSILLILILIASCSSNHKKPVEDPLPSWTNNELKESIIDYVGRVTSEGKDFIPEEDRIATFDNDGTLWAEQPLIQGMFAASQARKMGIKIDPTKIKDEKKLSEIVVKTHTGMDEETFQKEAQAFFEKALHPKFQVPLDKTIYQPQLELISYLAQNGFTVFITSGGTEEFMRVISQKYYNIPSDRVIGTEFAYTYDPSKNVIQRKAKIIFTDDKQNKPVAIEHHIGKRPVFASGNVGQGGDIYMLRYSQGSKYPSFQLLVNHDDAEREFAYAEPKGTSLQWAEKYNWNVVSMKKDWTTIFPEEPKKQ